MARAAQIDSSTIANARRANGAAHAEPDATPREVPIVLAPLIAPFKKQGRLALRIERLPQGARLSKGSKNNDSSWSLAPDEIEGLTYQMPPGVNGDHTLAVRIIGLTAGNTLAVLDFPVSPAASGASPQASADAPGQPQIQALHDELKKAKAELAARAAEIAKAQANAERAETELAEALLKAEHADTELAELRAKAAQGDAQPTKHDAKAELAAARGAWEAELRERLSAAAAQTAAQLQEGRKAWESEQRAQLAKAEAQAQDLVAAARASAEREAKDALAKAESAWASAEAERRAAADKQWQENLAKTAAEARAQTDQTRAKSHEDALRDVRENLAAAQAMVAERDAALAQIAKAHDDERNRLPDEMQDAVAKAEQRWKADEAVRLVAAEAQWRQKSADARTQSDVAREQDHQRELAGLREQLTALQATLAERETALTAATGAREADEKRLSEAKEALAKAEQSWKSGEAERLAAAEAHWKEASAKALADARAEATGAEPGGEPEFRALKDKLASLQALLAEREATLARADKAMEAAHLRWQKEAQQAIAKSVRERRANEAERLAAAESQARKQTARELADAITRYETAENALAQLRLNTKDDSRLQTELAALRASLAARESELAHTRSMISHYDDEDSSHADARHSGAASAQSRLPDKRRLMRDAAIAACVGVLAVMFLPEIKAFVFGAPPAPQKPLAVAETVVAPVAPVVERKATVLRFARVRNEPSKSASVLAGLTVGVEVSVLEERDKWLLVQFAAEDAKAAPRKGWVLASFLEDLPPAIRAASPDKSK